jgi:uncharacterized protein
MKPSLLGYLPPFTRIIFVILLVISSAVLFILAGILLAIPIFHLNLMQDLGTLNDAQNPAALPVLKFLQILQSIGVFIVPALLAGYLFERNATGYLGMKKRTGALPFIFAALIMIVSLPLINWMGSVNELMKLPASLKGIEEWMRDTEDQAGKLTDAFLDVTTIGGLCINLLMIAVLPALGEEMFFRGTLQRLFSEWFRNAHVAIFFTAFLFGAVHLQFYGILPRFALGLLFGYLYYWSGSLWVPILCHFINNGSAVVISYLVSRGVLNTGYEHFGESDNVLIIIGSTIITIIILYAFRRFQGKKAQPGDNLPGPELNP